MTTRTFKRTASTLDKKRNCKLSIFGSLVEGVKSFGNISGNQVALPNKKSFDTDRNNIASDWNRVGSSMYSSLKMKPKR